MHPRLSINQLCFPGSDLDRFADECRRIGVGSAVLASPPLLAEGGLAAARKAFGGKGPKIESISRPFAICPNLADDNGEAGRKLTRLIETGAQLGAQSVYLLTGGRGPLDWEHAAERFAELVAPCADLARQRGLRLLIEPAPFLYCDIHIAHSLADAILLAERTNLGVCLELFACWAEANLKALFKRAVPRCALVQVSDYVPGDRSLPARAVPGDGVIPLDALIGDILNAGYEGMFDLELLGPRIDTEGHFAAVTRSAERVSEMLEKLGA